MHGGGRECKNLSRSPYTRLYAASVYLRGPSGTGEGSYVCQRHTDSWPDDELQRFRYDIGGGECRHGA
jgi:hypothetical protein